jgi:phosphohistidine phosphatase
MELYLLRHAEAEESRVQDEQRALTSKGQKQARMVGKFCRMHSFIPQIILSSPLLRAEQTARILALELDLPDIVRLEEFLRPGMSPQRALSYLEKCSERGSIFLVGHEPDFSNLAGTLIGARAENIRIRKATLVSLSLPQVESGSATINFHIPVKCL